MNYAVPRKGFFERGDKKIKENDIFANVIHAHCYLAGRGVYWHKIPKLQITPPKIRVRNDETTEEEKVALEYIQNGKIETVDIQKEKNNTQNEDITSKNEKDKVTIRINKLGLSWAKLSHSWGLKLEFEVDV